LRLFGLTENTIEALRAEVRKNMERELNQAIKGKVKEQVIKGLLATHEVEVPAALIDGEVEVLRRQASATLRPKHGREKLTRIASSIVH
jgi:trigger factor